MDAEATAKPSVDSGLGSIGLMGLPTSGKTAFLVAIHHSPGRVGDWAFSIHSHELGRYYLQLGDSIEGSDRRLWVQTSAATVSRYLKLFEGYRRRFSLLRRLIGHRYVVSVPDMSGEHFQWLSGSRPFHEDDRDKVAQLRRQLRSCRGLICLVDPTLDTAEVGGQVVELRTVLASVIEERKLEEPLVLSVAFTKCDLLREKGRNRIEMTRANSQLVQALLRAGQSLAMAGIEEDGSRVRYDVDDVAELLPREAAFDQALAWDFLHCHLPKVGAQLRAMADNNDQFDVAVFLISSWGRPLPRDENGRELVPRPDDIEPVRVLAPLGSVLDRLDNRRIERIRRRRRLQVAAALVLLLLIGPLSVPIAGWLASRSVEAGELDSAGTVLSVMDWHPVIAVDRALVPERLAGLARVNLDLARACEARRRNGSGYRKRALVAAGRAIRLHPKLEYKRWCAGVLTRDITDKLAERKPFDALQALIGSGGTLDWDDTVDDVTRRCFAACVEEVVAAIRTISEQGPSGTDSLRERVRKITSACGEISRPHFFVEKGGILRSPAEPMARNYRAVAHTCLARLELAVAKNNAETADTRDAREAVENALRIARDAGAAQIASARAAASELAAFELLQMAGRLDAAAAETSPENQAVEMRALVQLVHRVPELADRVDDVLRSFSDDVWRLLRQHLADVDRRSPQADDRLAANLLTVLETVRALRGEERCRTKQAEVARGLLEFQRDVLGKARNRSFPADVPERVKQIRALIADSASSLSVSLPANESWDLEAALQASLAGLRQMVADSCVQVVQSGDPRQLREWRNAIDAVIAPGTRDGRAARLSQAVAVYEKFREHEDAGLGGAAPDALRALLKAGTLDDVEARSVLAEVGRQLCRARNTLPAAFAYRRCLEPEHDTSGSRTQALREITVVFRDDLIAPRSDAVLDDARMRDLIDGLLGTLADSPSATDELLWLYRAALAGGAKHYLRAQRGKLVESMASDLTARQERGQGEGPYRAVLDDLASEGDRLLKSGKRDTIDAWLRDHAALLPLESSLAKIRDCLDALVPFLAERTAPPEVATKAIRPLLSGLPDTELSDRMLAIGQRLAQSSLERAFAYRAAITTQGCSGLRLEALQRIHDALRARLLDPARKGTNMPRLFAAYVDLVADEPNGGAELKRLFGLRWAARMPDWFRDNLISLAKRIATVVTDERERDGLFGRELDEVAARLERGDPVPDIDCTPYVKAMRADGARKAIVAVEQLNRWLLSGGFKRFGQGRDAYYLGVREVTVREYEAFLRENARRPPQQRVRLEIDFKEAGEDYSFEAGMKLSPAYERRINTAAGRAPRGDVSVFGVDPRSVQAYLRSRGARLPEKHEWERAAATSGRARHSPTAMTAESLRRVRDVTPQGVVGLSFGVREWVTDRGVPLLCGASWYQESDGWETRATSAGGRRVDVGFRIALDAVPQALQDVLKD